MSKISRFLEKEFVRIEFIAGLSGIIIFSMYLYWLIGKINFLEFFGFTGFFLVSIRLAYKKGKSMAEEREF